MTQTLLKTASMIFTCKYKITKLLSSVVLEWSTSTTSIQLQLLQDQHDWVIDVLTSAWFEQNKWIKSTSIISFQSLVFRLKISMPLMFT